MSDLVIFLIVVLIMVVCIIGARSTAVPVEEKLYIVARDRIGQVLLLTIHRFTGERVAVLNDEFEFTWLPDLARVEVRRVGASKQARFEIGCPHDFEGVLFYPTTNESVIKTATEMLTDEVLDRDSPNPSAEETLVEQVKRATTWYIIFAEPGTLSHIVLTPWGWKRYGFRPGERVDMEIFHKLLTLREAYASLGILFPEEQDRPRNSSYRDRPRECDVQQFADGIQKTIVMYALVGNQSHGYTLNRLFCVKPRPVDLLMSH